MVMLGTDLVGRTVLVTGASGGIGGVTAARLGALGAHVVAHYGGNRAAAEMAVSHIEASRRLVVEADLSSPAGARELWAKAVEWRDGVDVLVNNAAVMPWSSIDGSDDDWDASWAAALSVNATAPAALMREAVKHYEGRGGGVLITISSWAAQQGSGHPDLVAYAASKAALKAATQTIARARARHGVLAYVVAPGVVDTELSRRVAATSDFWKDLVMGERVPPEDVAEVVAFLASGRVRHLSGATLDVNGGSYIR
jgi:NAD(P)-dependent dehydrogenase (short-subunit alcohol dehydrogenase family)